MTSGPGDADGRSGHPGPARVVAEADGGSRGNPGSAAYGAVLKDAATGGLIAERGERIGVATNNVAEYRGLIAALELYNAHAEGAELEVRMDSKLVVEQMSGRWKIKHPDMRPLAERARSLAPAGTTYTWIPRGENVHADRLANEALDGPLGVVVGEAPTARDAAQDAEVTETAVARTDEVDPDHAEPVPTPPWEQGAPTVLVLVRHGETDDTSARLFSGHSGRDPELNALGRAHVAAAASWLAPLFEEPPVVLTSPLRRTRETAAVLVEAISRELGAGADLEAVVDDGLVEAGFGTWEGLTYTQVLERDAELFTAWLGDPDRRAGTTGDSMNGMAERMRVVRDRLLETYAARVVVAATHLTPIKMLVSEVLGLPMESVFKTEISPASVTVLAWYPDGRAVVRLLNGRPGGPALGTGAGVG
ncbi:bifunctional RNase H/acid phosphatase [Nocardioides sp. HDW12B]|uniref:bifunctional RNase H/acid phosphatase n=1 Tax=Nocardioides sp. HDW12B TaxID=2714939 RepID=UPI0014073F20|nr:bifunctional RNase H/acid phosphatase [Nocardioides sp. HDW12B]QIK65938.1 bifunctional RNase H/acid phosphatase [Nocardioides sp. HDW12B]